MTFNRADGARVINNVVSTTMRTLYQHRLEFVLNALAQDKEVYETFTQIETVYHNKFRVDNLSESAKLDEYKILDIYNTLVLDLSHNLQIKIYGFQDGNYYAIASRLKERIVNILIGGK